MESGEQELDKYFSDGKISMVGLDITEIPTYLGKKYGPITTSLTITFCQLTNVSNLEEFTNLVSLVLDNNQIGCSNNIFPHIPSLETLWINNNNIEYLDRFLRSVSGKFPKLNYLSMLKNPCCPNYFVGKATKDYQKYRAEVIKEIPTLKFLDSSPVTTEEQSEANKLRSTVSRPTADQYTKQGDGYSVPEEQGLQKLQCSETNKNKNKIYFGKTDCLPDGPKSQGNRFIVDKNL